MNTCAPCSACVSASGAGGPCSPAGAQHAGESTCDVLASVASLLSSLCGAAGKGKALDCCLARARPRASDAPLHRAAYRAACHSMLACRCGWQRGTSQPRPDTPVQQARCRAPPQAQAALQFQELERLHACEARHARATRKACCGESPLG